MAESKIKSESVTFKREPHLPCPKRAFNGEDFEIDDLVKNIFETLCPEQLIVKNIFAAVGNGTYPCVWDVRYKRNINHDRIIRGHLRRNKPHGSHITAFRKEADTGDWIVHYGIIECGCPPALQGLNKKVVNAVTEVPRKTPAIQESREEVVNAVTEGPRETPAIQESREVVDAATEDPSNVPLVIKSENQQ